MSNIKFIDLHKHSFMLCMLLDNCNNGSNSHIQTNNGISLHFWDNATEWLGLASSIIQVEVDVSRFDTSGLYCGDVWDYQSQRNVLLSRLATELTTFNFIWGAFESLISIINPPKVPKNLKPRSSYIDEVIFFLKTEYEPTSAPLTLYKETINRLKELTVEILSEDVFELQPIVGVTGVGIHVVRLIRNDFAHGSMAIPEPEDWQDNKPFEPELINVSSRIVLLTIQMLLIAFLKEKNFRVSYLEDIDNCTVTNKDVHIALNKLHLQPSVVDNE